MGRGFAQMNADFKNIKHKELTDRIIGIFYKVYNKLGYGFLEKIYEKAMVIELEKEGIPVESQFPIQVNYDGVVIGEYFADMLVDSKVIVEIKAAREIVAEHEAQLLNYLKATNMDGGGRL